MKGYNKSKTQVSRDNKKYRRAKVLFIPIVAGVAIFFWFFEGLEGAMVGFGYGIVGGLFLIHESLPVNNNTIACPRGMPKQRVPESEKKNDEPGYLRT